MDDARSKGVSWGGPGVVAPARSTAAPVRCGICGCRLGRSVYYLEETGADVPAPPQSWILCRDCNAAVKDQMARAPVRSPMRLRVAVAIVSTERTPAARRAHFGELSDSGWTKLLFWSFWLAMLVHLAIVVLVAFIAGH